MADSSVVAALRATDIFSSLGHRSLGKIADACREVRHPVGKEISTQGTDGVGFHLITEGTASVDVAGAPRPELGPGQYFGEISLVDGKPRSATVVATSPMTTLSLASWQFQPILESEPEVAKALLLLMCARLRAAEAS